MIVTHPPSRVTRVVARAGAVASSSMLAVTVWAMSAQPPPAFAAGTPVGAATVKTMDGVADLGSGDSATVFTLRPPLGATCPGDSANDSYRWQTYMVPSTVDPATLTFDANGPVPQNTGDAFRQPLYDPGGSAVVNQQTANATPPPGPGPIIGIPNMTYALYEPGNIPAGVYNVGIACTLGAESETQMKDFWNVQVTFTTDAGGGPARVTWTAAQATTTTPTTAPVSSTTTPPSGSSTTTPPGATTTTRGTATTAPPGSSTTSPSTSVAGVSSAPAWAGSESKLLVGGALVLLVLGRMAVLVGRRQRLRSRQ